MSSYTLMQSTEFDILYMRFLHFKFVILFLFVKLKPNVIILAFNISIIYKCKQNKPVQLFSGI
jgi:hypothetical protein